jgi:hypothetical protein
MGVSLVMGLPLYRWGEIWGYPSWIGKPQMVSCNNPWVAVIFSGYALPIELPRRTTDPSLIFLCMQTLKANIGTSIKPF